MEKRLNLALNNFAAIPESLVDRTHGKTVAAVQVQLATLFHHYYLDSYGSAPPNPDPAFFEHVQFLCETEDFRFLGEALGNTVSFRRNKSNELGHAFCRWFLHEHLGITYFSPVDKMLGRKKLVARGGYTVERTTTGDTPDYFCGTSKVRDVFLAEAK